MPPLLTFTDIGIYCPAGDFYIDPWQGVERAVITHAHSDHARWGSKYYLAHSDSAPILKMRLGADIHLETKAYTETIHINGVKISLHPAGHIPGSAQVRVEYNGEVWVAEGDYKTENDGVSAPIEIVPCHTFITESTFGLPVYRWKPQQEIFTGINQWWQQNQTKGRTSILFGYSLGKAQRILQNIDKTIGSVYAHTAIYNTQQALIDFGLPYHPVKQWTYDTPKDTNALIIAPPSANGSPWLKRFEPYATAVCSGWMQVRGIHRRSNADAGFVLSDHADWDGLLQVVKATGAENIFVTHGYQATFARYLRELGLNAAEVVTNYGNEETIEDTTIPA